MAPNTAFWDDTKGSKIKVIHEYLLLLFSVQIIVPGWKMFSEKSQDRGPSQLQSMTYICIHEV